MKIEDTVLFRKIYGCLLGGAIGDAMGGPVEGKHYKEIAKMFGRVEDFLEYSSAAPDFHYAWSRRAGTYTDDTRLKHLLCNAIIRKNGVPTTQDFARECIKYYHEAKDDLARGWMEEYYLKSVYGYSKPIFGGQPTNAGIMCISPIGLVNACDPRKATYDAYQACFITEGYAREAAACMAAAIAAAVKSDATVDSVVEDSLNALLQCKIEGSIWPRQPWFIRISRPNENAVREAVEIAKKYEDVFEMREECYRRLSKPLMADGTETLAVSMAIFYAAEGDVQKTIIGGVNYGRDNDSIAGVAGGLAGAFQGVDRIPKRWIKTVMDANPEPDMKELAVELYNTVRAEALRSKNKASYLEKMMS